MLKTTITRVGQQYVDEPVYEEISRARPLSLAINSALHALEAAATGRESAAPRVRACIEGISHYDRVQLRWMKPDGNGGVVPRANKGR